MGGYRPAWDEGSGTPGASCPTGGCGKLHQSPWVAGAQRSARGRKEWVEIDAKTIPKRGPPPATTPAALSEAESAETAAGQIQGFARQPQSPARSTRPGSLLGTPPVLPQGPQGFMAEQFRAASRCARGREASGLHNDNAFFLLTAPLPFSFCRPKKKMGVENCRAFPAPPVGRPEKEKPPSGGSRSFYFCP